MARKSRVKVSGPPATGAVDTNANPDNAPASGDDPVAPKRATEPAVSDAARSESTGEAAEETGDGVMEVDVSEPASDPLAEARTEATEWRDRCLRTAAEYDNYRKRVARDRTKETLRARAAALRPLLEVLDTAQQAAEAEYPDMAAAVEGVTGLRRQLMEAMEAQGLVTIAPRGERFDLRRHEALMAVETDAAEPDTITKVVQRGYLLDGELLRPAKVIVARAPAKRPDPPEPPAVKSESTGD